MPRLRAVALTRRRLIRTGLPFLGGAALAALTGCDPLGRHLAPRPSPSPSGSDALLPVLSAEHALVKLYDDILARYPALAGRAGALRADHLAHLRSLGAIVRGADPGPPAGPAFVPVSTAAALAALRAAEHAAATRTGLACLAAPRSRAALLGSVAACESAHLVLLR